MPPSMAAIALLVVPRSARRRQRGARRGDSARASARARVQGLGFRNTGTHQFRPPFRHLQPRRQRGSLPLRRAQSGERRAAAARLGRCRGVAQQRAARPRAARGAAQVRRRAQTPATAQLRERSPSQRARSGLLSVCQLRGAELARGEAVSNFGAGFAVAAAPQKTRGRCLTAPAASVQSHVSTACAASPSPPPRAARGA